MELLLNGFGNILTPLNITLMLVSCFIGIIFGAIPGLTGTMAIALCLPFTYTMDMTTSFCILLALYIGGISGGLISAILINIPGTPASVGTCFDGYPLNQKGLSGKALAIGVFYSFLGTMFGILILIFLAPPLARVAMKFGMFEYFSVGIFSLTMVSALTGKSLSKGLIACCIGLFAACVGAAPIDNFARFTLGMHSFDAGFAQVPTLVGLFAIPEILKSAKENASFRVSTANIKVKGVGVTLKEFIQQGPNALVSAMIGTAIGILPGIGAATCNILAYGVAKKTSKYPEKFGTGIIDGVIATETSNNASIGGAMVPLITLGIPGDGVTAVLLGAFAMHGLQPGPMFFKTNVNLVYAIFAILLVCSLLTFIVQYFGLKGFIHLLRVPKSILLPAVMVLCMIGAFGINNRIFDIWTLLIFGLIGFILNYFGFALTPIIMGYILGPIVETYLRRGLMMSRGSIAPFFTRPISCAFLVLTLLVVFGTIITQIMQKRKNLKETLISAGKEAE